MGHLIPVWSYKHGWGKTSTTASLAYQLDSISEAKIMVLDSNFRFNELELMMGVKGFVSLDSLISCIEMSNISANAVNIKKTKIDILCSSKIQSYNSLEQLIQKDQNLFDSFIYVLKKTYDIILWDLNSGFNSEITKFVLNNSDMIMNIFKQHKQPVDEMYRNFQAYENLHEKTIYIINEYDETLGFDLMAIKSLLNSKRVFTLPYSVQVIEACNQSNLKDFIEKKGEYTKSLKKVSKEILSKTGIKLKEEKKQKLFNFIKKKGGLYGHNI